MAALLRARPSHNPLLPRPFSSSSSSSPFPPPASADPPAPSRFADIRDRLNPTAASTPRGHAAPSIDDLRRSLKTFRNSHATTAQSSSSTTASSTAPSFFDLFANTKSASASASTTAPATPSSSSPFPFGTLRDSLRKPGPAITGAKSLDWKSLLSHPQRPAAAATVLGLDPNKEKAGAKSDLVFLRQYTYDELGKRLHALRPAGAGKDGKEWFSLEELAARLGRLREMEREEREKKGPLSGLGTDALREALQVLQAKDQKKTKCGKDGTT